MSLDIVERPSIAFHPVEVDYSPSVVDLRAKRRDARRIELNKKTGSTWPNVVPRSTFDIIDSETVSVLEDMEEGRLRALQAKVSLAMASVSIDLSLMLYPDELESLALLEAREGYVGIQLTTPFLDRGVIAVSGERKREAVYPNGDTQLEAGQLDSAPLHRNHALRLKTHDIKGLRGLNSISHNIILDVGIDVLHSEVRKALS